MGVQVATGNLVICRTFWRVWAWLSVPCGDVKSQREAQPFTGGSGAVSRRGSKFDVVQWL